MAVKNHNVEYRSNLYVGKCIGGLHILLLLTATIPLKSILMVSFESLEM